MIKGISVIILSFLMVFNILGNPKIETQKEFKSYIGTLYNELPKEIKQLQAEKKIDIFYEAKGMIKTIEIKDSDIVVDSLRIGDKLDKVKEIYPKDWIVNSDEGIMILLQKTIHYGVVTQYIHYISQDGQTISGVQIGLTTDFVNKEIPKSQKIADEMLQGKWKSEQEKELVFTKGRLSDSVFDKLFEIEEYKIISPNEMIIYRTNKNYTDTVKVKFWVTGESLYLFLTDELGIPIESTIEKFNKIY